MPYYQLRVTPCQFNLEFNTALTVIPFIQKRSGFDPEMYITCDEKINKFGEECKRHFHFSFFADDKKDTLQKAIRTYYSEKDVVCKGNKCYCLQEIEEPADVKRWLRYSMKEKWIPQLTVLPFSDEEIKNMEIVAKDERQRGIDHNIKKRQKLLEKQTLSDKAFALLDKLAEKGQKVNTFYSVVCKLGDFYTKEKAAGKPCTIDAYAWNYLLERKHCTRHEWFVATHPHYHGPYE